MKARMLSNTNQLTLSYQPQHQQFIDKRLSPLPLSSLSTLNLKPDISTNFSRRASLISDYFDAKKKQEELSKNLKIVTRKSDFNEKTDKLDKLDKSEKYDKSEIIYDKKNLLAWKISEVDVSYYNLLNILDDFEDKSRTIKIF